MNRHLLAALAALIACAVCVSASADFVTPLTSFEPQEVDLTVSPGVPDQGVTVTRLPGGVDGAPPATDGDYVLKVEFSGEDGKVEFMLEWLTTAYDLAGHDTLLADVYIETPSAIPGLMGIFEQDWDPPDMWQPATGIPTITGAWTTISVDVSGRDQIALKRIWAFIFENMPGADGVAYVDNLRFVGSGEVAPSWLASNAFEDRYELAWRGLKVAGLEGYNVYRTADLAEPFVKVNDAPVADAHYVEPIAGGPPRYYYKVTAVIDGVETDPTNIVAAEYNGMTDDELLTMVQEAAFQYFWEYGHPVSGAAREAYQGWVETVASGGTGMGLMAICVAVERGFVTRSQASARVLNILDFFENQAERYHGAWAHWIHGTTGETLPFSQYDDGGDIVETSYFAQGLLTVRQYFDADDPVENDIRATATRLWEEIDWSWYRRYPDSNVLYWHWSPNYGWEMNMPIRGYNETMITYIMAIASPTHGVPASMYLDGWAELEWYENGKDFYGIHQWVGPDFGGPLFFTHYTHMGFDPRLKRDQFCNYYENSRNISLIHRAYAMDNPQHFDGYNRWAWGLTASASPPPWYYNAHSPTNDNGTIAPTAALSAIPYTPEESLATIRYFHDHYGVALWGPYGFYDAFNETESWVSDNYIAIDQGPIVVMIENYRTGLCWNLFMSNAEIRPAVRAMGWTFTGDLDDDGYVNMTDFSILCTCLTAPGNPPTCLEADFDADNDTDMADVWIFQQAASLP